MIVGIVATISLLGIDVYGHMHTHEMHMNNTSGSTAELECFLVSAQTPNLDISSAIILLPYTLQAIAEIFVYISGRIICSILFNRYNHLVVRISSREFMWSFNARH